MLVHDLFDYQARARGAAPFARFEGCALTYAQGRERSEVLGAALAAAGAAAGDRVCILMRNCVDALLFVYAASRAGVVLVPLNHRLAAREWVDIIADAGAQAIFADREFCDGLEEGLRESAVESLQARICMTDGSAWPSLADLAAGPAPAPVVVAAGDTLLQMYTSGTTGKPKGACISHANVLADITHNVFASPGKLNPGERTLVVLPLFHVAAISTALAAISCGAELIIHRDVNPPEIVRAMAEDEIVVVSLVPAVVQLILNVPGVESLEFPRLRLVGYGASPISEPLLRRAMATFHCDFIQGYGMTELAGASCLLTETDHRLALAGRPDLLLSAGRPLPGVGLRVVDADGQDSPVGEIGEILIQGPQVMLGYWNMPEATAEALRDGWMHTGDAGCLDADGYLFVRDRIKDMIVSGAENIYPAEIEAVLHRHPAIAEVSVIGVPDERWGETVMAVIVARSPETVTEEELDRFCRLHLGGFKVPRRYAFVSALPRNASGKVLKRELRRAYWSEDGRQVA